MLAVLNLNDSADIDQLAKFLPKHFAPADVANELRKSISLSRVKSILIEYPYVDKDYRSTYYNFYAKKGLHYDSFCSRIHFFAHTISLSDSLELTIDHGEESLEYLGFMVLRPTEYNTIGRTALSPKCIHDFTGHVMLTKHVTHLLGHRFEVKAFPFMMQHTDISVCAHVACWSILRYYSERFRRYAEFLTYDITRMATPDSPGGLVPSRGLVLSQAIEIFSKGGCYPDVYRKDPSDSALFYRSLYAYIESGIPVFAAMSGRSHAITIVGHGAVPNLPPQAQNKISYSWDMLQSLVVADDNFLPYKTVTNTSTPYSIKDIDAFIVPLPEKIYYSAEDVMAFTEQVINIGSIGTLDLALGPSPIIRCFLTTSSSFKGYVRSNSTSMPSELSIASLELPLPQFVWVVEISTTDDWAQKKCSARFIIDATASKYEIHPYFIAHSQNGVLIHERALTRHLSYLNFSAPASPQPLFINNLLHY